MVAQQTLAIGALIVELSQRTVETDNYPSLPFTDQPQHTIETHRRDALQCISTYTTVSRLRIFQMIKGDRKGRPYNTNEFREYR